jgi:succinyl-diaminopimelate desuccinylase
LNGHVDVVPAHDEQFAPKVTDNKLYGRGAYDMKFAALLMAYGFCRVAPTSSRKIGLQVVADEETGGYDGVAHHLKQGIRAAFVITGEMTDLKICNEARGVCWVEIAFKGVRAHGGHAWEGDNAIVKAGNFVGGVLQTYPMPAKRTWTTTASIAAITTSNETYNQVPQEATVKIDFRFTAENAVFTNKETVKQFVASLDPSAQVVAFPVFEPAVYVSPDHPELKRFVAAVAKATGTQQELAERHASSDARHFAAYNIPCVEFGLSGKNLHGDDEYAELDSVAKYCAALETFLSEPTNGQIYEEQSSVHAAAEARSDTHNHRPSSN